MRTPGSVRAAPALVQLLTSVRLLHPPGHKDVVGAAHHFHEKSRENDGQTSANTVLPIIAHHFHL
jgi:hypothetical protein